MSHVIIKNNKFDVKVAATEEEQTKGLMFVKWPPPVMCFPTYNPSIRKFWMKNTESALDIVFVKNAKIIEICDGEPYSTMLVGPNEETDLVIEFPKGTMKSIGARAGDGIELYYSFADRCNLLKPLTFRHRMVTL